MVQLKRYVVGALVLGAAACAPSAPATPTPSAPAGGAERVETRPEMTGTTAAITPNDLRQRLWTFADDSMQGREAGKVGNYKATEYLAAQARAIGLRPAGENGTYFQTVPMRMVTPDAGSTMSVGSTPIGSDAYMALPPIEGIFPVGSRIDVDDATVYYAGPLGGDVVLTPEQIRGSFVVFGPPMQQPDFASALAPYTAAAGVGLALLDMIPPQNLESLREPRPTVMEDGQTDVPGTAGFLIRMSMVQTLFGGKSISAMTPGEKADATLSAHGGFTVGPTEAPARNVVAVLPGTDPALRGEYVAIGAHNDHIGMTSEVLRHDSVYAYNRVIRREGVQSQPRKPSSVEAAHIAAMEDSLPPRDVRPDSINNGADDDGSGSVGVLEIAQKLAANPPERSILFVWHTGEELGMYGSRWFTDHPTVPRDSIVAQLNIDMIGRGMAKDLEGGGPNYVQLIGSRRLSTELGDLVESVNTQKGYDFAFDYQFDAPNHPQQYYCRSDHAMYARYGIPITFFTTGAHPDYHQITDEPQYINYDKLAKVSSLVADVAVAVADLDHRPVVDKPVGDPDEPCQQ